MSVNLDVAVGVSVVVVVFVVVFSWVYMKRRRSSASTRSRDEPRVGQSSVEVGSRELYEKGFEKESGELPVFEGPNEKAEWEKEAEEEV